MHAEYVERIVVPEHLLEAGRGPEAKRGLPEMPGREPEQAGDLRQAS